MSYELLLAGILVVALVAYSVTAGADFGGGVWDLLAFGPRARAQREMIARAVAPIWEANHVWLIFVIVVLFVCFTPVYAVIGTALHIPLTLMLFGIVLRGAAFAFRSYHYGPKQFYWDAVFAISSLVTPVALGMCVGAVASGAIDADVDGTVRSDFFSSWLAPFPVSVGAFTLIEFSFLAACYLTVEAEHEALREDFRLRAIGSGILTAVLGWLAFALAYQGAPLIFAGIAGNVMLIAGISVVALSAVGALFARKYRLAQILAISQVSLVVLGWANAQFPYLVVPDLTVHNAHASDAVMEGALAVLAIGSVVLVPSFVYLYAVFKGWRQQG